VSNLIIDTTLNAWLSARKTKRINNGWITGNAVCCTHRGETSDRKGRGGMIVSGGTISYHCFNCMFKTGYSSGRPLGLKFQKLLHWLGVDEKLIDTLRLESLRYSAEESQLIKEVAPLIEIPLPNDSQLLMDDPSKFPRYVKYLESRGFTPRDYPFYVSSQMRNRIILPFVRDGKLIGSTARSIDPNIQLRYKRSLQSPYVFGCDLQKKNWTWTIVVEGEFDALSVDGLGIGCNEISDEQAELINNTGLTPIVVGDADAGGQQLIQEAIDYGFPVSFPEWEPGVKDLNAAVLKYGKLAVIKHVWESKESNPLAIKIRKKLLQGKL